MLKVMHAQIPQYTDLMWPTLQAVKALGGSASIEELDEAVIEREGFSQELQEVLHGDGPRTEIRYRLAWARTYLKGMGLTANSQRGVWSITEKARGVVESDLRPLHAEFSVENRRKGAERRTSKSAQLDRKRAISITALPDTAVAEAEAESYWKETLLDIMLTMSPAGFEWLAQRLLREQVSLA